MQSDVRILVARTGYLWAIHVIELEDERCPLIEG